MIYATVAGHLGRDAETRPAGDTTVTDISIASSKKVRGEDHTTWVRCSIWGERGEKLKAYLTKGTAVTVVGELSQREYEKNGEKRTVLELRVQELFFSGGKREQGQQVLPKSSGREPWEDHL